MRIVKKTYRLNRFLSRCGVASRRHAEALITEGKVRVNGQVADHPGIQVDPGQDEVRLGARLLSLIEPVTLILHKPKGVVCTRSDPQGRRTIHDLFPSKLVKRGLQSVGRLDFESSGLLILTSDGDLHRLLEHPSSRIDRVYRVKARGVLDEAKIERLKSGIELEEGKSRFAAVEELRVSGGISRFTVTLREGRNREVRRLCAAVGLEVLDLKRVRFGEIDLGDLPSGKYRDTTFQEERFFEKIRKRGRKRRA
ncbi:MAG: rRNA pseudouridine synthase [Candidatus Omnitrophica bacterium]|nr:Ribosomal large subunit pseudouridine synthase B [bacterium]NUN95831.1 rRNA pseudouridine synthase [Candidatus Omnitrophota bacterium]